MFLRKVYSGGRGRGRAACIFLLGKVVQSRENCLSLQPDGKRDPSGEGASLGGAASIFCGKALRELPLTAADGA